MYRSNKNVINGVTASLVEVVSLAVSVRVSTDFAWIFSFCPVCGPSRVILHDINVQFQ